MPTNEAAIALHLAFADIQNAEAGYKETIYALRDIIARKDEEITMLKNKPQEQTHYPDCWLSHHECAIAEVRRLRPALWALQLLVASWDAQSQGVAMQKTWHEALETARDALTKNS